MMTTTSLDELRTRLRDAGVQFGNRSGEARLIQLANDNGVELPEAGPKGGNVVPARFRERYGRDQNCGDDFAEYLKEATTVTEGKRELCSEAALMAIAQQNDVDLGRWAHLNLGMQRMNLGNVLRGKFRRGERVFIGDREFQQEAEAEEALD